MFPTVQNDISSLRSALVEKTQDSDQSGSDSGVGFLVFSGKKNEWTYGRDKEDVAGQKFLINSATFTHGWILWHQKKCHTSMVSIMQPLPPEPDPMAKPNGELSTASEGRGFQGKWLDSDETVKFESSTYGGRQAVSKVIAQVKQRAAQGSNHIFPLVELDSYSYTNNNGDEVYSPELKVVSWLNAEGETEGPALEAPEEKAPTRRTRRA